MEFKTCDRIREEWHEAMWFQERLHAKAIRSFEFQWFNFLLLFKENGCRGRFHFRWSQAVFVVRVKENRKKEDIGSMPWTHYCHLTFVKLDHRINWRKILTCAPAVLHDFLATLASLRFRPMQLNCSPLPCQIDRRNETKLVVTINRPHDKTVKIFRWRHACAQFMFRMRFGEKRREHFQVDICRMRLSHFAKTTNTFRAVSVRVVFCRFKWISPEKTFSSHAKSFFIRAMVSVGCRTRARTAPTEASKIEKALCSTTAIKS